MRLDSQLTTQGCRDTPVEEQQAFLEASSPSGGIEGWSPSDADTEHRYEEGKTRLRRDKKGLINGSRGHVTAFTTVDSLKVLELREEPWEAEYGKRQYEIAQENWSSVPVVTFENGIKLTVPPGTDSTTIDPAAIFRSEMGGVGVCKRWQVPLKLAWALSIHKCQGLTLESGIISPNGIFENGQCYVAVSRVKSLQGLQLGSSIEERHIKANPKVVKFYNGRLSVAKPNAKKLIRSQTRSAQRQ